MVAPRRDQSRTSGVKVVVEEASRDSMSYHAGVSGGLEGEVCQEVKKGIRWRDEIHGTLEESGRSIAGEEGFYERMSAMRERSKTARLLTSLLLMSFVVPFLMLGSTMGKTVPTLFPAQQWSFTAINPVGPGSALHAPTHSLASGGNHTAAAAAVLRPSVVEASSKALAGGMKLQAIKDDVPRSIWSFGPFVMFAGVVLSLLAKLLLAQPCAKFSTDAIRSLMKAQLEAQGEARPDLEQGLPDKALLRPSSTDEEYCSWDDPSPMATRRDILIREREREENAEGRRREREENAEGRRSVEPQSPAASSSGSGKWKVSLDIPFQEGESPSRRSRSSSSSISNCSRDASRDGSEGGATRRSSAETQAAASGEIEREEGMSPMGPTRSLPDGFASGGAK